MLNIKLEIVFALILQIAGSGMLLFADNRTELPLIFSAFYLSALGYFMVLWRAEFLSFRFALVAGFLSRALLFADLPILSDDYFRFIWDGILWQHDVHPFLFTPQEIMNHQLLPATEYHEYLLQQMNSPNYYSVYPTVMQAVFYLATKWTATHEWMTVALMRSIIILAEIGTLFFLKKILIFLKKPVCYVWLYWLNPLVIFELSGNLHFEALMICFVTGSIYFLLQNRIVVAALLFSGAILTKLIPLMLLPLLFFQLGFKKGLWFCSICLTAVVLGFAIIMNQELLIHLWNSVHLYFSHFEFNASLFYLLKQFDFSFTGQQKARFWGRVLPALALVIILILSFKMNRKKTSGISLSFFNKAEIILWVYYLLALIVHPWYLCFPLLFSVFSRKSFIPAWTLFVFPTYWTYRQVPYQESMIWIAIEYSIVLLIFLYQMVASAPFALAKKING